MVSPLSRVLLLALLSATSHAFIPRQGFGLPRKPAQSTSIDQAREAVVMLASSKIVEKDTDPAEKQITNSSKRKKKKDLGFGKTKPGKEQKQEDEIESVAAETTDDVTPWYADTNQVASDDPVSEISSSGDEATTALIEEKQSLTETDDGTEENSVDSEQNSQVEPDLVESSSTEVTGEVTAEGSSEVAVDESSVGDVDLAPGSDAFAVEAPVEFDSLSAVDEAVRAAETSTVQSNDASASEIADVVLEPVMESTPGGVGVPPSPEDDAVEQYIKSLEEKMRMLDEKIADVLQVSEAVANAAKLPEDSNVVEDRSFTTSLAPDRPDVFLPLRPAATKTQIRSLRVDSPSFLTGDDFINGSPPRPATTGGSRIQPPVVAAKQRPSETLAADRADIFSPGSPRRDVYLPGSPQATAQNAPRSFPEPTSTKGASSFLSVDRADVFLPGSTHPGVHLPGSPQRTITSTSKPTPLPSLPVDKPGFLTGEAFITGTTSPPATASGNLVQTRAPLPSDRADVLMPGTPHPDVYLPGSPDAAAIANRGQQEQVAKQAPPPSLEVDRPDALLPARPGAQSATTRNLASDLATKLRSLPVDTPESSFDNGDAADSETPPLPAKSAPTVANDSPSFSADRPDVFLPASPRPADSKPSLTSQQLASIRPTLPVDTPTAFNPGPDWKK